MAALEMIPTLSWPDNSVIKAVATKLDDLISVLATWQENQFLNVSSDLHIYAKAHMCTYACVQAHTHASNKHEFKKEEITININWDYM